MASGFQLLMTYITSARDEYATKQKDLLVKQGW
jgi:hypothetical protein